MDLKSYVAAPGVRVVETVSGPMACFVNDTGVSARLAAYGEFAAAEIAVYRLLLSPGDTVVDVGANIGAISAALQRDRRDYRIWAFEPQAAFQALAAVNLLGGAGATVLPLAVGAEDGQIELADVDLRGRGNYGSLSVATPGARVTPVPMVRLDTYLAARAPRPRLIKIDVEGMEGAVIEGATGLFHPNLVLSVEADRPEHVAGWLPRLIEDGFACFLLFSRIVSRDNPRFDERDPACRLRAAHVMAFCGSPSPAFLDRYAGMRIADMDEYRARIGL